MTPDKIRSLLFPDNCARMTNSQGDVTYDATHRCERQRNRPWPMNLCMYAQFMEQNCFTRTKTLGMKAVFATVTAPYTPTT